MLHLCKFWGLVKVFLLWLSAAISLSQTDGLFGPYIPLSPTPYSLWRQPGKNEPKSRITEVTRATGAGHTSD